MDEVDDETTGTIEITIRLRLNMNIPMSEVDKFVNEIDYSVKDEKGLICDTEIVDITP